MAKAMASWLALTSAPHNKYNGVAGLAGVMYSISASTGISAAPAWVHQRISVMASPVIKHQHVACAWLVWHGENGINHRYGTVAN
jgi:hypothetical protein